MGHSCRTLLWDTLVGHSCETLLSDTVAGHSCGTLLWGFQLHRLLRVLKLHYKVASARLHFARSTRTISAEGCAGTGQIALSPAFRALDAHDLRRGWCGHRINRTLACISRTRHEQRCSLSSVLSEFCAKDMVFFIFGVSSLRLCSKRRGFFSFSFCHIVRRIRHGQLQKIIHHLNELDGMLKDMVEKGSLTEEQGRSVQHTLLDKMNSLRRQQVLLELFWFEIEGPAFLNCSQHIFQGLSSFKANQKHWCGWDPYSPAAKGSP